MIYTVTLNPSLDYNMFFKEVKLGTLNRASREMSLIGGKGINISLVLHNYGDPSVSLGFIAGFVGDEIQRGMQDKGCRTDFIRIPKGCSRINVKAKEVYGQETELNGVGPDIREQDIQKLLEKISLIKAGDTLILSGQAPHNVSCNVYARIAEALPSSDIQLIVDAEKEYLFPILPFHPLLIKPNNFELGRMIGKNIKEKSDVVQGTHVLRSLGARNILVSMGKHGAFFSGEDGSEMFMDAPKGTVINTVGAGDSMVAGFISYYETGHALSECARYAVASGSAKAFSEALPVKMKADELYEGITVLPA